MRRAYCTYFDSNYLARGLVMIRSLLSQEPAAEIHVLALDEDCARVLEAMLEPAVRIVPVDRLHAYDAELAAVKGRRNPWEFYATHKPVLARYILEGIDAPDALTFIDADIWFFDRLSAMYEEIGGASIALSPHRFNQSNQRLAIYGPYNAGFIYWRNDSVGRRALEDWRSECLEWCHERAEPDGRFMNQGYLRRWPERYERVHVIRNPGVNLAPWNLDSHEIKRQGHRITVDDVALVCFHFSGIVRTPEGWYTSYPFDASRFEMAREAIYSPYLRAVETKSQMLSAEYGISGTGSVRLIVARPSRTQLWP